MYKRKISEQRQKQFEMLAIIFWVNNFSQRGHKRGMRLLSGVPMMHQVFSLHSCSALRRSNWKTVEWTRKAKCVRCSEWVMREWSSSSERKWINGCPIHVERCSFIMVEYNTRASEDRKPPARATQVLERNGRHTRKLCVMRAATGEETWTAWVSVHWDYKGKCRLPEPMLLMSWFAFPILPIHLPCQTHTYSGLDLFNTSAISTLSLEDIDWNELSTKRSRQYRGKTRNNLKPRI